VHDDALFIDAHTIVGGVIRRRADSGKPRGVARGLLTFRTQMEIADVDDMRCRRHHSGE